MRLLQERRASSAFSELVAQHPALSQLVYMFVIDGALVTYVPSSGMPCAFPLAHDPPP